MFQFTTTTVINANEDYTSGLKPLWSAQEATDDKPASLNIKRHLNFKQPNIVSITKAEYSEPKIAKATLDLSALGKNEGNFRIAMYIKLAQSSANSYYANDLVFKGKPLYIEFVWKKGEEASDVALKVKEIVKKFMIAVYEKSLVKVTAEGTKVVITGTDEYQRFVKVDIEEFVNNDVPMFGTFEVIKSALPESLKDDPNYDSNFTIEQGEEGFGTYQWILKNLRLPTAAKTSWTAITADEAPIIGAKYDEFVIRYCVNRGIMGGDAVGEVTKSLTTHVFYVNKEISADFEAALNKVAPESGIEKVPADKEQVVSAQAASVDDND
jgi:hypothetical protein